VSRNFRNQGNTQGQEDVITHPLLSNSTGAQPSGSSGSRNLMDEAFSRRNDGPGLSNWQDFEDIIGGSAVRMLENLLTNAPAAAQAGPLRVDIQSGPGGILRTFEFDRGIHSSTSHGHRSSAGTGTANDQVQESLAILHDFQPMSSGERWNQEARMMYGANLSDKALKLVNAILNILIPIAIEDDKKARAEEEKKRQEQRRKEEEERRKAEEEKWRLEKEARKAAAEAAANAAESSAASEEPASTVPETAATAESQVQTEATDEASTEKKPDETTESEAVTTEPSAEAERTTVMINGEPVDISGTGIDVEFLEALPDDLREEVLNQHMRDRPTPVQPAEDDSISPEFLNALPPDIRQEVLHQEAIERERRERQSRQVPANTPASTNTPTNATNTGANNTAAPSGTDLIYLCILI
jgi:E3 ubiquitin-protein ligase HUWE1